MGYTLTTALEELRARIDEPNQSFWQTSDLTNWLNEGCIEVVRNSECLTGDQAVAVASGASSFTMPPDVLRVNTVEWQNTGDPQTFTLEYTARQDMSATWGRIRSIQGYRPMYFYSPLPPAGATGLLFPVPASSGTLTVVYWRMPVAMVAGTDALDLPIGWETLAIDYAEALAQKADSNPNYRQTLTDYSTRLLQMMAKTMTASDQMGNMRFQPSPEIYGYDY